ncbi:MAG TPA: 5-deoxy-glucuronate isomerase [bacterium]|nr:5-deoxy-glucuronate isomerase [bacterium]
MAKKYKVNSFEGYQRIISPENSDIKKMNFSVIRNKKNLNYKGTTNGEESVFVLTEGNVKFFLGNNLLAEMMRKNVFSEPPSAIYLPPYTEYFIEFSEDSEICIAGCQARGTGKPKLIEPKDMLFSRKGQDGYLRSVTEIVNENFPSEKLILGETISDPGNWVSYPPHKHDTDNLPEEVAMEEIYYFKINPRTGFGTIRVFSDSEDNIFVVKNSEIVTIPSGYHPISVAPGHQIYYLWIMAGETKKFVSYIHPDYRFLEK